MFIQTETTPNPQTLKFLPGCVILPEGVAEFLDAETAAKASPLCAKLFAIPGVNGVFLGYDFIAVTKHSGEWEHLKPAILGIIMEHLTANMPIMLHTSSDAHHNQQQEFFDPKDHDLVETIKELLETRVKPAVARDGGDISFRGFEDGVVYLTMRGACSGCPSSTATLKHGIENLLRHFIPEVHSVEAL